MAYSDGFLVGLHPPCVGYMIRRYEAEHVGDYFFSQVGQEGFSSSFHFFFLSVETGCIYIKRERQKKFGQCLFIHHVE